jgi:hypothetical protein
MCTGRCLATSWSPVKGVLPTVLDLVTEVKRTVSWSWPRPELGCRARGKKRYYKFYFAKRQVYLALLGALVLFSYSTYFEVTCLVYITSFVLYPLLFIFHFNWYCYLVYCEINYPPLIFTLLNISQRYGISHVTLLCTVKTAGCVMSSYALLVYLHIKYADFRYLICSKKKRIIKWPYFPGDM